MAASTHTCVVEADWNWKRTKDIAVDQKWIKKEDKNDIYFTPVVGNWRRCRVSEKTEQITYQLSAIAERDFGVWHNEDDDGGGGRGSEINYVKQPQDQS